MKKHRFETLVPAELQACIHGRSLVLLPVGSMEWHGPHMGMGMDTLNAAEVARRAAEALDGLFMPPLFIGTETPRSREQLLKLGFEETEHIVGMDFPGNSVKSFYWPPELFEALMRTQLTMMLEMGFRQVVIINGHGADKQLEILNRVCGELSQRYAACVTSFMALVEGCGAGLGHAGLAETAIFMDLCPEAVDLDRLPPRDIPLKNIDYAIVDSETFDVGPNDDRTVRYDPRDATAELGERIIAYTSERAIEHISSAWDTFCGGAKP
ncbi:MAG: creatininase family protein [Clostridia bacterium]|nr:creatininase family protein [Clostridia bacterium]